MTRVVRYLNPALSVGKIQGLAGAQVQPDDELTAADAAAMRQVHSSPFIIAAHVSGFCAVAAHGSPRCSTPTSAVHRFNDRCGHCRGPASGAVDLLGPLANDALLVLFASTTARRP